MAKGKKALTKSGLYAHLAEASGLTKKQVSDLFDHLGEAIKTQLGPKGAGVFTLPGIARIKLRKVKAVKGGQKKINPITKTEYITKDKPAHNKVRILPIKAFAEAVK